MRLFRQQEGFTLAEATVVASVLTIMIAAAFGLLETGRLMDQQAEDGFQAQDEGRQVLTALARRMRPAENMSAPGVPLVYASNQGTFIDLKVDTTQDSDNRSQIVRIELDRPTKRIVMYLDYADTTGATEGQYNHQTSNHTYLEHYRVPSQLADWDEAEVMAQKVVNAPPDGSETTPWSAQTITTDPHQDYRLFTFYGDDFDAPLDTVSLGGIWVNYVRGVKIYLLSDIQPATIPSPFGNESNVHLRNISGE